MCVCLSESILSHSWQSCSRVLKATLRKRTRSGMNGQPRQSQWTALSVGAPVFHTYRAPSVRCTHRKSVSPASFAVSAVKSKNVTLQTAGTSLKRHRNSSPASFRTYSFFHPAAWNAATSDHECTPRDGGTTHSEEPGSQGFVVRVTLRPLESPVPRTETLISFSFCSFWVFFHWRQTES